jgi:hypothetical protein
MKVRTTGRAPLGARLAALCWGALTLLVPLTVSACTTSLSATPTVPNSTHVTTSAPAVGSTGGTGTGTAMVGAASGNAVATHTATATATVTITPTPNLIPDAAPVTGGGGTAGLQDGLLFAVGTAAILVGAGSIIYRRRLTRGR